MTDRKDRIASHLAARGLDGWKRTALAGDASRRRYERLFGPMGESLILMDAPPEIAGSIDPFVTIGAHLRNIGLRAPRLDLADPDLGLIVMEDFGDDLLARRCTDRPEEEPELYALAAEVIAYLQAHTPALNLPCLDATEGVRLVAEVASWIPVRKDNIDTLLSQLDITLRDTLPGPLTMALRDYHAENLVLCGDGEGIQRLGLLDYQDAVMAPSVYDLASLIRDVRRDVSVEAAKAAVARFAQLTGTTPEALAPGLAAQAVQRNLRILGIFHRLARRDGKVRYLDFLPRLHALLKQDLAQPALASLAAAAEPLFEDQPHDA